MKLTLSGMYTRFKLSQLARALSLISLTDAGRHSSSRALQAQNTYSGNTVIVSGRTISCRP